MFERSVYRNYDALIHMELDEDFRGPKPETAAIRKNFAVETTNREIQAFLVENPEAIAYLISFAEQPAALTMAVSFAN